MLVNSIACNMPIIIFQGGKRVRRGGVETVQKHRAAQRRFRTVETSSLLVIRVTALELMSTHVPGLMVN